MTSSITTRSFARGLLGVAALVLLAGGVLHARAFSGAVSVLAAVEPHFYSGSFKALWLIDSATLVSLAALFVFGVVRPRVLTRWALIFLSLIPAATSVLIYTFVGPFFPAHLLLAAAAAVLVAGLNWQVSD
jgi:hypothetical protein